MTSKWVGGLAAGFLLACATGAKADGDDDLDPSTLYEITTEGSSRKLEVGKPGTFVFAVKTVEGAYISDEAPLKIDLTGRNVKVDKAKLTMADSVTRKEGQKPPPDPRFEVPITADAKGKGQVEAKAVLFICTEKICVRQQRTVAVPVEVN